VNFQKLTKTHKPQKQWQQQYRKLLFASNTAAAATTITTTVTTTTNTTATVVAVVVVVVVPKKVGIFCHLTISTVHQSGLVYYYHYYKIYQPA